MQTKYENKASEDHPRIVEVPLMINLVCTDTGDKVALERQIVCFCQSFVSKGGELFKRGTYWEWSNGDD